MCVFSASDELYSLAEYLSEPSMVKDAVATLDAATTDFRALADRLDMQQAVERDSQASQPGSARGSGGGGGGGGGGTKRRAMAWDVRTTTPVRTRVSVLELLERSILRTYKGLYASS